MECDKDGVGRINILMCESNLHSSLHQIEEEVGVKHDRLHQTPLFVETTPRMCELIDVTNRNIIFTLGWMNNRKVATEEGFDGESPDAESRHMRALNRIDDDRSRGCCRTKNPSEIHRLNQVLYDQVWDTDGNLSGGVTTERNTKD